MKKLPKVLIITGSSSDLPFFEEAQTLLKRFQIAYEIKILSAHRSPKLLVSQIEHLPSSVNVIIAAAGGAAHLAGVIAAHTLLPVLAVPMDSKLKGVDSFVSMSQMPSGIPAATLSIGKAGATNAALLAAEILSLHQPSIRKHLLEHRKSMIKKIQEANRSLLN